MRVWLSSLDRGTMWAAVMFNTYHTIINMGCCCSSEGRTERVTMVYDPNPKWSGSRPSSMEVGLGETGGDWGELGNWG